MPPLRLDAGSNRGRDLNSRNVEPLLLTKRAREVFERIAFYSDAIVCAIPECDRPARKTPLNSELSRDSIARFVTRLLTLVTVMSATTTFSVDPQEKLTYVVMAQLMPNDTAIMQRVETLIYQAIVV